MAKRRVKPLGTTTQELKACIAAFQKYPDATHAWCCHHAHLCEALWVARYSSWMDRIHYIRVTKDRKEKPARFRNFRPVIGKSKTRAAFNREWPDNTWNGRDIFPSK